MRPKNEPVIVPCGLLPGVFGVANGPVLARRTPSGIRLSWQSRFPRVPGATTGRGGVHPRRELLVREGERDYPALAALFRPKP